MSKPNYPYIKSVYDGIPFSPGINFEGEKVFTRQDHHELCDLGKIVEYHNRVGDLKEVIAAESVKAKYADVSESVDFMQQTSMLRDFQYKAADSFAELPAAVRARFKNVHNLSEFLSDDENLEEFYDLMGHEKVDPETPPQPEKGEEVEDSGA